MRRIGGCTFCEDPACGALQARLLWYARHDASVLRVTAQHAAALDDDTFDLAVIKQRATVGIAPSGREYVAISDGFQRIRLNVVQGSLLGGPVRLHHHLIGFRNVDHQILTLRRLKALVRTGSVATSLLPSDPYAKRIALALRVHDALVAGASHREIAIALFGLDVVDRDWSGPSDFLKSRVRRMVALAHKLADGEWRRLIK